MRDVLEGSVRKGGSRVRITAQLKRPRPARISGPIAFDGSVEEVFELQDQIALNVAGVIEPALQSAEIRRSAGRATKELTA